MLVAVLFFILLFIPIKLYTISYSNISSQVESIWNIGFSSIKPIAIRFLVGNNEIKIDFAKTKTKIVEIDRKNKHKNKLLKPIDTKFILSSLKVKKIDVKLCLDSNDALAESLIYSALTILFYNVTKALDVKSRDIKIFYQDNRDSFRIELNIIIKFSLFLIIVKYLKILIKKR